MDRKYKCAISVLLLAVYAGAVFEIGRRLSAPCGAFSFHRDFTWQAIEPGEHALYTVPNDTACGVVVDINLITDEDLRMYWKDESGVPLLDGFRVFAQGTIHYRSVFSDPGAAPGNTFVLESAGWSRARVGGRVEIQSLSPVGSITFFAFLMTAFFALLLFAGVSAMWMFALTFKNN